MRYITQLMASAIRLTVANAFVELYLHLILAIIYMSADKDEYVQFCDSQLGLCHANKSETDPLLPGAGSRSV